MRGSDVNQRPESTSSSVDTALEVVADQRRRVVIQYLRETSDGVSSFEDCVTSVCTNCDGKRDPERIRTDLWHSTLPKLEAAGIVAFDSRSETVRYHPDATVEHLLDTVEKLADTETTKR